MYKIFALTLFLFKDGPAVVNTVYSLSINADSEIGLVAGNMYCFRIEALYDAPNSKFNYAKV